MNCYFDNNFVNSIIHENHEVDRKKSLNKNINSKTMKDDDDDNKLDWLCKLTLSLIISCCLLEFKNIF